MHVERATEDTPCITPEPKVKASSPIGISVEDLDDAENDWGNFDDEEPKTAPSTVETQARPKPSTGQLLAQALCSPTAAAQTPVVASPLPDAGARGRGQG